MEQNFLFIHNTHSELFTVSIDDDNDNPPFDKYVFKNIKKIIKKNNLNGKFSLVNLFNGIHKKYNIDINNNNNQIAGTLEHTSEHDDFDPHSKYAQSWNSFKLYLNKNINKSNIDTNHIKILHTQLINDGKLLNLSEYEINKMVTNLLQSLNSNLS